MRTEVHKHIGSEAITCPQIRGNIWMRRGCIGTVQYLESVVTRPCGVLREHYDITELYASDAELTVGGSHILPGELAIGVYYLFVLVGAKTLGYPRLVILFTDKQRVAFFHKLGYCPLGINTENGTLLHYHFFEFLMISRQIVYFISFGFEAFEQVIQRRSHLHSSCTHHGTVSCSFVVIDSYAFFAVRLSFQCQVVLYRFDKRL